jgi:hypothetical protein
MVPQYRRYGTRGSPISSREVLHRIRDMIAVLIADEELADLSDTIEVLRHVVDWSLLLLDANGEPTAPLLENKTELHRGFRDWILMNPLPKRLRVLDEGEVPDLDEGEVADLREREIPDH